MRAELYNVRKTEICAQQLLLGKSTKKVLDACVVFSCTSGVAPGMETIGLAIEFVMLP